MHHTLHAVFICDGCTVEIPVSPDAIRMACRVYGPLAAALLLLSVSSSWGGAGEAAWVARINGKPTMTRAGKTEPLKNGDAIQRNDVIETDDQSKVKILLADDSVLNIGPRSRVALEEFLLDPRSRRVRLRVLVGRFQIAIAKFFGGPSDYEIRTPTAVSGVRGTVLWGDTELDAICALDGTIEVRSLKAAGTPAHLDAGECVNQLVEGKTARYRPTAQQLSAYLKEVTLD